MITAITRCDAPKLITPEFRLYYDDSGRVICYSCDKLLENYIVVDALTFAESRYDVYVVDGKVQKTRSQFVHGKIIPGADTGVICEAEDVSIIASASTENTITWGRVFR